jgi:phosphoglycerol transferase MdoB-like AlkP superfamily enzyme
VGERTAIQTGGHGIGMLLFLVFLVLKLAGVISWSWWWVTAPLWGGVALFLVFVLGAFLFVLVGEVLRRPHA